MPTPFIYLDPTCDDCRDTVAEVTWCPHPAQPDCELCGRPPIRYRLDPVHWTPAPVDDDE